MIFEKLSKLQAITKSLAPDAKGQTGAAYYNYVSGAKLLGYLRPAMDELKLILNQEVVEITNQPITYQTSKGSKTEMFTSIKLRFTWIDCEDSSTLTSDFYANGMNAWDKGLGSALTYAERYYLLKFFHIATDEDDVDALKKPEAIQMSSAREDFDTYNPLPEDQYWQVVKNYCTGKMTKAGIDYKRAWIQNTHADPVAIAKFDNDCQNYLGALNNN